MRSLTSKGRANFNFHAIEVLFHILVKNFEVGLRAYEIDAFFCNFFAEKKVEEAV